MSGQMQGQVYRGPVERYIYGVGAAITAVTVTANHVAISIPAGKGGTLVEVQVIIKSALTTVVNSGGWINLHNSSTDWIPFEAFLPAQTMLTSGAVEMKPYRIACSKYLPGNSTVYVDYTAYDDQNQYLEVILKYILGPKPVEETFSKTTPLDNWKKASAVSTVARTNWGVVAIPGAKGGTMTSLGAMYWPTLENAISRGGALVDWTVDSHDLLPMYMHTQVSATATSGAILVEPDLYPCRDVVIANSNYTIYGTSNDDQSHSIGGMVCWKRPYTG